MSNDGHTLDREASGDELDALLAPISDESPAGQDLRAGGAAPYRELDDLLQGRGKGRGRSPEQNAADALAQVVRLLLRESKDLALACYGLQALLGTRGVTGFQLGLRLLRGLHERMFLALHPQLPLPTASAEERAAAFPRVLRERKRLIERADFVMQDALLKFPLCPSPASDERVYGSFWWLELERGATDVTIEDLNAVARLQPRAYYESLVESLHGSCRECDALNLKLDRLYGELARENQLDFDAPFLGGTGQSLRSCLQVAEALLRLSTGPTSTSTSTSAAADADTAPSERSAEPAAPVPSAPAFGRVERYLPQDRADALDVLRNVAVYLQAQEPLSPVPCILLRALRWGRSGSFSSWLEEMFTEAQTPKERVLIELGLSIPPEEEAGGGAPTSALSPQSRDDALVMLSDIASYLHSQEPLSPIPYLLLRAVSWARAESPARWLLQLFPEQDATLQQIRQTLGLAAAEGEH